ncbi:DUF1295 domain-containing protein [Candidatus Bathyarchaeota archaeon]|nr:DUF1295 domain-containing protein [Candidatus Bathyarchaeota archaeon]
MKKLTGLGLWMLMTICWFAFQSLLYWPYMAPSCFAIVNLAYNTFIPNNTYSWIYWGISALIYLAYKQNLMGPSIDRKIKALRHITEAIISLSLFLLQHIPFSGGLFTMLLPIAGLILHLPTYILDLIANPDLLTYEVFYQRLSTIAGILALLIIVVGSTIFAESFIHFLKNRGSLVTDDLYSVVRHPQYLGLILMVLGLSLLCMGLAADLLLAAIGYILLAGYEEWNLMREHKEEYFRIW